MHVWLQKEFHVSQTKIIKFIITLDLHCFNNFLCQNGRYPFKYKGCRTSHKWFRMLLPFFHRKVPTLCSVAFLGHGVSISTNTNNLACYESSKTNQNLGFCYSVTALIFKHRDDFKLKIINLNRPFGPNRCDKSKIQPTFIRDKADREI